MVEMSGNPRRDLASFQASPLLYEQMRSFVELATTLNLSEAVRRLGSTRQTVRRHIAYLEEVRGEPLFSVHDRRYALTDAGKSALREAQELIARGKAWLVNASGHNNGLFYLSSKHVRGFTYYLQQHPLGKLWDSTSDLLPFGLQCWAMARGRLEADAFQPIRPWLMIFRRLEEDWVCVEVGEESSFATWYGWKRKSSSVGRGIATLPGGNDFADLLSQPFQETRMTEGLRLDHIHTRIPTSVEGELKPITYERLMMGCFFPDGSAAIAALINRTWDVSIDGMPDGLAETMSEDMLMKFTPP